MSLFELIGTLFAGLGLFFIGIKRLGSRMKQLSGISFRRRLTRITGRPLTAALLGFLSGAITQSTTAVTFITTNLIASGSLAVRRATPVLIWSNLGSTLIIFLATLDIRVTTLYLLGLVGLGYYFHLERQPRWRDLTGSLFAIALLLLGLSFLKLGGEELRQLDTIRHLLQAIDGVPLALITIGALLAIVAQSSTSVAVVVATLVHVDLLHFESAVETLIGANIGSGLSILLLGANLRGTPRQLALFQCGFKTTGALLFALFFFISNANGFVDWNTLPAQLGLDPSLALALSFVAMQLVATLLLLPLNPFVCHLLAHLSPPSSEETLSRCQYLYDRAVDDPASAIDLVMLEQARVARSLPDLLEPLRAQPEQTPAMSPPAIDRACRSLLHEIDAFLDRLQAQDPSRDVALSLNRAHSVNEQLHALLEALLDLHALLASFNPDTLRPLSHKLTEALHLILSLTPELVLGHEEYEVLEKLTTDRSRQMEEIRAQWLAENHRISSETQRALFRTTGLFERIIWLVRRILMQVHFREATEDR